MRKRAVICLVSLIGVTAPASAQMDHSHHMAAMQEPAAGAVIPTSPGQETFGAIAEIVAILRADPKTDWSRVDIAGLRRHLLDMDDLVMRVEPKEEPVEGGLRITIARNGPGGAAASRMVPAHAPVLKDETGWSSVAEVSDDSIVWTVTATAEHDVAEIRSLGFFGLIATGAHHQLHHLAMARGAPMH